MLANATAHTCLCFYVNIHIDSFFMNVFIMMCVSIFLTVVIYRMYLSEMT